MEKTDSSKRAEEKAQETNNDAGIHSFADSRIP